MAYYPGYSSYMPMYVPDPWQTTYVPRFYPEHHHVFEHTRNAVTKALREIGHSFSLYGEGMINPASDVHETESRYFIDIELPGTESEEKVNLKWIGQRTLLVKADISRETIPEDAIEAQEQAQDKPAEPAIANTEDRSASTKTAPSTLKVHQTVSERRLGHFGRCFSFPVDVDHDKTSANLKAGVLRLIVSKAKNVPKVDKYVKVHASS